MLMEAACSVNTSKWSACGRGRAAEHCLDWCSATPISSPAIEEEIRMRRATLLNSRSGTAFLAQPQQTRRSG